MTDRRFVNHQHLDPEGARLKVQCRFCRHKEQYNRFQHVAACGCMGPTRYVHRTCLQTWCTVKFEHVYNQPYEGDPLQFNVFCEMCQQKMEIEFSLTKKCSKYDEFLQKLQQDKLVFVVVLLLAITFVALLVFIIIFSSISSINGNLLAIVISTCLIALIADITFFCWKFLLIKSIDIEHVANHKDPPKLLAFAEQDINNVYQQESYKDDPHFGQALSRANPADKSLMLQSKRNSVTEKSSVQSKTFTDIVMRQMYRHDIPSEKQVTSNEPPKSQYASRKSRNTAFQNKRKPQIIKEESQQKQYAQQAIQVTGFKDKKDSTEKSRTAIEREDRSIQMSRNERSAQVQVSRSKSKSRSNRIFQKSEPESSQSENKNQKSRKVEILKQQEQIKQIEVKQEPKFTPSSSEQQMQVRRYNIIKQKSFSQEEKEQHHRPTVKKVQMQKQSVHKQSKLKLKNLKDPIKIKIRF